MSETEAKPASASGLGAVVSEVTKAHQILVDEVMKILQPGITESVAGLVDLVHDERLFSQIEILSVMLDKLQPDSDLTEAQLEGFNLAREKLESYRDDLQEESERLAMAALAFSQQEGDEDEHVHSPNCFADPNAKGALWFVMVDERDGWEGGWSTKEQAYEVLQTEFADLEEVVMAQIDTEANTSEDAPVRFIVEPFRVHFTDPMGLPLVSPREVPVKKKVLS